MKLKHFLNRIRIAVGFYSVILSSCVSVTSDSLIDMSEKVVVNPELQPYFDEFIEMCAKYSESKEHCRERLPGFIGFGFGYMNSSEMVGYCIHTGRFFNHLSFSVIHEKYFKTLPEFQKRDLVFHELGHCLLGLDHTEDGIMKPSLDSSWYYEYNWDDYAHEMFSRKNQVEF